MASGPRNASRRKRSARQNSRVRSAGTRATRSWQPAQGGQPVALPAAIIIPSGVYDTDSGTRRDYTWSPQYTRLPDQEPGEDHPVRRQSPPRASNFPGLAGQNLLRAGATWFVAIKT